MLFASLVLALLLSRGSLATRNATSEVTREARDSYLDAYKASHTDVGLLKSQPVTAAPVFVKPVQVYPLSVSQLHTTPAAKASYGPPDAKYPDSLYSAPLRVPVSSYGAPQKIATSYGPSDSKYGPSEPEKLIKYEMGSSVPWYGVPHFHHHYTMQSKPITEPEPVPEGGHGGFDLKTVFKFVVKLLVLKGIVKMMYLVMYLLFVPKLNLLDILGAGDSEEKPDSAETAQDDKPEDELDDDDSLFRGSRQLDVLAFQVARALSSPPS